MIKQAHERLRSRRHVGFADLAIGEVVPYLVGHTVKEVERELIIHTLARHHGSRTISCRVLGISIRCLRNKIREFEELGIGVPGPQEPRDLCHH